MFSWLRKRRGKPDTDPPIFAGSIAIDISGPEFDDIGPSRQALQRRLEGVAYFRRESHGWIAEEISKAIRGGASNHTVLQRVVAYGTPADRPDGIAKSFQVVGSAFLESIAANQPSAATKALREIILLASAEASKRHNLRRHTEAGIDRFQFSGANDERSTAFEKEMEGREFCAEEVRRLIDQRADDMPRSVFLAIVAID